MSRLLAGEAVSLAQVIKCELRHRQHWQDWQDRQDKGTAGKHLQSHLRVPASIEWSLKTGLSN